MDDSGFDRLARSLGGLRTRRAAVLLLGGAVAGSTVTPEPAAAKRKKRKKPCNAPKAKCGGKCLAIQSDASNCGACGNVCAAGQSCQGGQCGGQCGSLDSQSNCGTCGNVCAPGDFCQNQACQPRYVSDSYLTDVDPQDIFIDPDGFMFVADQIRHCVWRYTPAGVLQVTFGVCGQLGPASDNRYLYQPRGVVAKGEIVIISDWGNNRVQVFFRNGAWLQRWASGFAFNYPDKMALDSAGNVYILEPDSHRVLKFDANAQVTRVFGTGTPGSSNTQLDGPSGVAIDRQGNVYVTDRGNHRVQKFSSDGTYLQTFGAGFGTAPGQLRRPQGCAVASNGDVFVGDYSNDRVQQFSASGAVVRVFTDVPVPGQPDLKLIGPVALAVDAQDNLYVGDEDLHGIVHLKLNAPKPS